MGSLLQYFAIATFVALFSIIFQAYNESSSLQHLTEILTHLIKLEKVSRQEVPKVVIGYGSCSDLTVRAVDFLNYSDTFRDFSKSSGDKDEINDLNDFLRSFSFYFAKGAAAERYTPNKEMFLKLVSLAKKHESAEWSLGGNAPIMGSRFLMEQMEVLLAATMSDKQKSHLINGFDMIKFEPGADFVDDIHLILEYKTGDEFGEHKAIRANR
jgi:ADP-dependent glucokinase